MELILNKIVRHVREKRISFFAKKNAKSIAYAPYSLTLYEEYMLRIKNNPRFNIIAFDEAIDKTKANCIFRHDLDTSTCLKNSDRLINFHTKHSIPLSVYVRMDDIDYPANESYPYVAQNLSKISLGLHSSCYIHEDPFDALRLEIDKFQDIYGFSPKFLTLHGLGSYRNEARHQFIKDFSNVYLKLGFTFTDVISNLRHYDYVVQDCHVDNNSKRYLKGDILVHLPVIKGACYLLLAHPCYWV